MVSLQMDYRSMVHDKDEAIYAEVRVTILDIRGFYVSPSTATAYCTAETQPVEFLLTLFLYSYRLSCMTSSARMQRK